MRSRRKSSFCVARCCVSPLLLRAALLSVRYWVSAAGCCRCSSVPVLFCKRKCCCDPSRRVTANKKITALLLFVSCLALPSAGLRMNT